MVLQSYPALHYGDISQLPETCPCTCLVVGGARKNKKGSTLSLRACFINTSRDTQRRIVFWKNILTWRNVKKKVILQNSKLQFFVFFKIRGGSFLCFSCHSRSRKPDWCSQSRAGKTQEIVWEDIQSVEMLVEIKLCCLDSCAPVCFGQL